MTKATVALKPAAMKASAMKPAAMKAPALDDAALDAPAVHAARDAASAAGNGRAADGHRRARRQCQDDLAKPAPVHDVSSLG
ncbi:MULTISPECIES: hypothetical protein [Burkholderiaceae]|uniref:hypothetical protein n=1 Tax=Burkholderiaceae TaxID=119060 RepID=UPI0015870C70|nr:hypothetical protein [Ralstonia sp. 25mfcol4.1]